MAIIRIKRSGSGGSPGALAQGEMGYSFLGGTQSNGGDRLYIGTGTETAGVAANIEVIGGKYFTDKLDHTPGTLTANSALIVDANSKIDVLNIDNITINGNEISSTNLNGNITLNPNGTGTVDVSSSKIVNLSNPTAAQDAVTLSYLEASFSANLAISGDSGTDVITLLNETLNFAGGTALTSVVSSNTVTFNLDNTTVTPGSYGNTTSIATFTVDQQGRLTAAGTANIATVLSIAGDTGTDGISLISDTLTVTGGTGLTSAVTNNNITLNLDNTAVTPGTYGSATATTTFVVDQQGRITSAIANTISIPHTQVNDWDEAVQDTVGGMLTGTQNGITVTYTDNGVGGGYLNFDVADPTITLSGDVAGSATMTNLGNVTISTTIQPNSVALGTDTTGNYIGTGAVSGNGLSGSATGEGSVFTVTSNATALNTGSTIVFRDASGNFAAGTVTAALVGNASTATTLETARNIALAGDVVGTVSFDGSSNVSISTTIQPNSVALGTDTTGNYIGTGAVSGNGLSGSATGEGSAFTVTSNATNLNTASTIVFRDASGNFAAGTITGALSGNASTATTLQTARTIALSGDVVGSVSFNGSANATISTTIQPNSVALGTDTTGNYVASLVAGTGVTLANNSGETATPTISIGQDVSNTANVTFNDGNFTGNLVIDGNFTVAGTTSTISTSNLAVSDNMIYMNQGIEVAVTNAVGNGTNVVYTTGTNNYTVGMAVSVSGMNPVSFNLTNSTITAANTTSFTVASTVTDTFVSGGIARAKASSNPDLGWAAGYYAGSYAHAGLFRDASDGNFKVFEGYTLEPDASVFIDTTHASFGLANFQANNFIGNLQGVANTALALNTARTISLSGDVVGSVSFNGASNVNITTTIQANSVALGTDTTGNYAGTVAVSGSGLSLTGTAGEGTAYTIASNATATNTVSTLVFRDASGNFSAGNITAALTGNASTATTLETARTIAIAGDVVGSASFDGSSNVSITATIQPNSVALGTDTTGNYAGTVAVSGSGLGITGSAGEGTAYTITSNATALSTASTIVLRDVSQNFTANTITAALVGNASTATTLETARTITLAGDVAGSVSFDGSSNVSITATVQPNSVALGTDTTGNYAGTVAVSGNGLSITGSAGEGTAYTVASNGTSLATASTLVYRDSVGNFSANTVTAALTGNASTATTLETARTITLAGDVAGSVSFDGSSNVSITTAVQPNSVALGTDTTGNYVATVAVTAGTGLSISGSGSETAAVTIAGVNATTTVKGVASFDTNNFTVTSGAVSVTAIDGGTY